MSFYASCLEVFVEFKDSDYFVVEDHRLYNVTVVKHGEPKNKTKVAVSFIPDPTSHDPAECKRLTV